MRILGSLLGIVFMIFLVSIVGSVVLEQFPELVPLWEELKMHVVNVYEISYVKYGALPTLFLIIAIVVLIGTSSRH